MNYLNARIALGGAVQLGEGANVLASYSDEATFCRFHACDSVVQFNNLHTPQPLHAMPTHAEVARGFLLVVRQFRASIQMLDAATRGDGPQEPRWWCAMMDAQRAVMECARTVTATFAPPQESTDDSEAWTHGDGRM